MNDGKWQKEFITKLKKQGISHDDAMKAMGLVCEYRQIAYIQGYEKGYNDGYKKHIDDVSRKG